MKTLELKLKKDVLIVDLPEGYEFTAIGNDKEIYYAIKLDENYTKISNGKECKFLCKGSELTEEIASELVDKSIYTGLYAYYVDNIPVNTYCYNSAIESIISYVKIEGFHWLEKECDNQFCENGKVDVGYNTFLNCQVCEEAEEKTFKNPLIFVKK